MDWSIVQSILRFLYIITEIYNYVFLVYIFLSFFPIDENNFLVKVVRGICEPLYIAVLRILPPLRIGMIDLSPIYVFILISIVQFVLNSLSGVISRL